MIENSNIKPSRVFKILSIATPIGILGYTAYLNAIIIYEAYGPGYPFYSRTTNMDKWDSPVPMLAVIDLVALLISVSLYILFKKRGTQKQS